MDLPPPGVYYYCQKEKKENATTMHTHKSTPDGFGSRRHQQGRRRR